MAEYSETPAIHENDRMASSPKVHSLALRLGTDHLWLVVVFAAFLFFTSLVPLIPNDFWWHLKIGEIIASGRTIPSTNLFAWTLSPGHPFTYGAWLAEYLFYLIYQIGKLELLLFLRNLLALALFALLAFEAKRRSGSWRIAAFVVALAWSMVFNNLDIRPQIWSWLPFMAYVIILSRFVDGELSRGWLFTLPIVMVFWANAHGAFVLGIAIIGAYLVGEVLAALLRLPQAISWRDIRWLGLIGLLSLLGTLVNPQTFRLAGYVVGLMTDAPIQAFIMEWRSPTPQGASNIAFFLSILLLLISLAYASFRPRLSEVILLSGLLWLAWSGQRYIIWYALAATPLLAQLLGNLRFNLPRMKPRKNRLNLLVAALLLLPVVFVQPWLIEKFPLPKNYWDGVFINSSLGPLLSRKNPVEAADYLKANPGGKLFNEMGYGSYLIWALPAGSVFIDPRVELYPFDQWQDYLYISHGVRFNELLEKYGATRILLDKELQPELARSLASGAAWTKEYEDQGAQIWRKQ